LVVSSYDATAAIADAIKSVVAQPLGSMRFLPQSDEEVALAIIDGIEAAGFEIVRREVQSSG
jgi:hypothetical protein